MFWLGYWLPRLDEAARHELVEEIVGLMRDGILLTTARRRYSLDDISAAVTDAETTGRQGKTLLVPGPRQPTAGGF